jgi:cyclic pyranopterin phosphate synthase
MEFTHLDKNQRPQMVDVSDKKETHRTAKAKVEVFLGSEIISKINDGEIQGKKGAVFATAIIAGTMAVKQTDKMIPLCHSLPIQSVHFDVEILDEESVKIDCEVKTNAQTGVEMEALHGASIAALTVYDMCKAISHDIQIKNLCLMEKTGGKRDFKR